MWTIAPSLGRWWTVRCYQSGNLWQLIIAPQTDSLPPSPLSPALAIWLVNPRSTLSPVRDYLRPWVAGAGRVRSSGSIVGECGLVSAGGRRPARLDRGDVFRLPPPSLPDLWTMAGTNQSPRRLWTRARPAPAAVCIHRLMAIRCRRRAVALMTVHEANLRRYRRRQCHRCHRHHPCVPAESSGSKGLLHNEFGGPLFRRFDSFYALVATFFNIVF